MLFTEFLTKLKNNSDELFKFLEKHEKNFKDASFDELLSNQDDVLSGVNRVQKNFTNKFFNMFDASLIKHYDNGDTKLILYTTTSNAKKVIEFSQAIFTEFGHGLYDDNRYTPFTNHKKIILLSKGIYDNENDDIAHLWLHELINVFLQYRINPLRQFSLMITKKLAKQKDRTIRRNGTILNLITININNILSQKEIYKTTNYAGERPTSIDYTYILEKKQLGVFDKIKIRIFGTDRVFMESVYTHIFLTSSSTINPDDKILIVEKLIKIYGEDDGGNGEIEIHEREILEKDEYWTGRKWGLNQSHGLWDMTNKSEKLSYMVNVDKIDDSEGFNISILGYNELVSLFGIDE